MKTLRITWLNVLFAGILSLPVLAQAPSWSWATDEISSPLREHVAHDSVGNAYRAGRTLAKYDPNGTLLWSHSLVASAGNAYVNALTADMNGNTIISGYIIGTIQLDTITLKSFNRQDIFIAKFNSSGSVLWARRAGGIRKTPPPIMCCSIEDGAFSMTLDQAGNSFIYGATFNDTLNFDGLLFVPDSAALPSFIAKYNAFGVVQWVQEVENFRSPVFIAIGLNGGYYLAGRATQQGPPGQGKTFIEKYNAVGALEWRRWSAGQGFEIIYNMVSDAQGNCYITGNNEATTTFGAFTLPVTSTQSKNMFLVKYNKNGQAMWAKQATSSKVSGITASTNAEAVAVDNQLNVYVAGGFTNNASFAGQTPITSISQPWPDIFVAKYDSTGNFLWVQKAGGSGSDWAESITALSNGDCYVTGNYDNSCTFGQVTLPPPAGGAFTAFTARLAASPTGISETNAGKAFSLYPNPAASYLTIKPANLKKGLVTVYNTTGQKVYEADPKPEMQIPIANWPSGIYAVKITSLEKTITQKLVIAR